MNPAHVQPYRSSQQRGQQGSRHPGMRRRIRLMLFVFACFLAWAGATFWEQNAILNEKMSKLLLLEEKLEAVKEEHAVYLREIDRLHDPEYIEQRLRKDHLMIKEGETLFIRTK